MFAVQKVASRTSSTRGSQTPRWRRPEKNWVHSDLQRQGDQGPQRARTNGNCNASRTFQNIQHPQTEQSTNSFTPAPRLPPQLLGCNRSERLPGPQGREGCRMLQPPQSSAGTVRRVLAKQLSSFEKIHKNTQPPKTTPRKDHSIYIYSG